MPEKWNLNGARINADRTETITITLPDNDTGAMFINGDTVTVCAVMEDGTHLFEKTATYTPNSKTATLQLTTSDLNASNLGDNNSIGVEYSIKVTNSITGNVTDLVLDGGKTENRFVFRKPRC